MLFTLGHSTHDPVTFKNILQMAELDGIIDVRSHPTSRWPWWHQTPAEGWLLRGGFTYAWFPALGGWDVRHATLLDWAEPRGVKLQSYIKGHFPKQRIGADADQGYEHRPEWESKWTSQGLHDYAWYTSIEEFQKGINWLVDAFGGKGTARVALVCSEAMWWKCHRSMIADVLRFRGVMIQHVMPNKRSVRITEHDAMPRLDRYPVEVLARWEHYARRAS